MTKRFPATELVHDLCERAKADVAHCDQLWPIVAEHSRRGGARMPAGAEGGGHPEGVHSDPTADAVIRALEMPVEPEVVMRRAMLAVLDALHRLDLARKAMEAQVPAIAAAISSGRKPTDGRTMAEVIALREHSRAVRGDIVCLACQHPTARLLAGFDEACYKAWTRAGRPDRGQWVPQRRAFLDGQDKERTELEALRATRKFAPFAPPTWDPSVHTTIGPADGADRRAA